MSLLIAVPLILSAIVTAGGNPTTMMVVPSTKTVATNDTFPINITITSVTNLYSWQFKMYYKKMLTCQSVTEGEFLKRNGNSTFWPGANINNNYNSTHGRLMVSCSRTGAVPGETGSGILATITFKALSAGSTALHLFDTGLFDPPGVGANPITHGTSDGQVTVTGPPNNPPSATNLKITPSTPTTDNNLVGSYTYSDLDGDPESGTEIKWYKDSIHQATYDNLLTIPFTATAVGEEWYFKVKPKDGTDFGTEVESPHVTIVAVSPAPPVGGVWVPIDTLALLAPWILVALIAGAVAAYGMYKRHVTRKL